MKKVLWCSVACIFVVGLYSLVFGAEQSGEKKDPVPVKGMVTMLDLGADKCIPCKMMEPIIEKLKKVYDGKVAIVFIDVRKDKSKVAEYGIRAIPTQIFFDKNGREVFRHLGFLSEEEIVTQLKAMGVE